MQNLRKRLASRGSFATFCIGYTTWSIPRIEEQSATSRHRDEHLWGQSQHLHNTGQLLHLILARKQWKSRVQLGQNAACKSQIIWQLVLISILLQLFIIVTLLQSFWVSDKRIDLDSMLLLNGRHVLDANWPQVTVYSPICRSPPGICLW